jgi:hypothetical protein
MHDAGLPKRALVTQQLAQTLAFRPVGEVTTIDGRKDGFGACARVGM